MAPETKVFIAGVGFSPVSSKDARSRDSIASQVSAATKALLDAGVTYDDVQGGVTSSELGTGAFQSFDEEGISIDEVESGTEFLNSLKLVSNRGSRCVLMVAGEEVFSVLRETLLSDG